MFILITGALNWLGMWKLWDKVAHNRIGGGQEAEAPQVIPAPQAPNYQQTADEVAQAQLKYNPQLTAQNVQLQSQYAPQLAQSQYDVTAKYTPLYRALLEQQFPQINTLSGQVSDRLASPTSLTPEQQAAQDAVRQRAFQQSERGIRSSANVGGTLYGGQRQLREDRSRNELAQNFAVEDINRQAQQRQQALSELSMLFQLAGLNVQNPTVQQGNILQGTDSLYNALVQNQGNFGIIPGTQATPSPLWDLAGQSIGAAGSALGLIAVGCHVAEELYGPTDIRTILARFYVWTHESWFTRAYRKHSKAWAGWVRRIPILKLLARPIWDRLWMKAFEEAI